MRAASLGSSASVMPGGIDVVVAEPHKRKPNIRKGGYGENFATNRRGAWTH